MLDLHPPFSRHGIAKTSFVSAHGLSKTLVITRNNHSLKPVIFYMKRSCIIVALLATLCGGAMAQATDSIDTSQFVAVYDYECRTQDDEGGDVTDKMSVVVQVGKGCGEVDAFLRLCSCCRAFNSRLGKESTGGIHAHADGVDGIGAWANHRAAIMRRIRPTMCRT